MDPQGNLPTPNQAAQPPQPPLQQPPQQPQQFQQPQQQPQQPPQSPGFEISFTAALSNCWNFFKNNLGLYVGLYLVSIIPLIIGGAIIFAGLFSAVDNIESTTSPGGFSIESENISFDPETSSFEIEDTSLTETKTVTGTLDTNEVNLGLVLGGVAVMLLAIPVGLITQAGILTASLKIMRENTKVSFSEGWKLGVQNFGKYFVASLVVGLIVIGGFILLIVPGIIFFMWYYVAVASAIDNKTSVSVALADSKRLTEGKRLAIFGILFGVGLLSGVLGLVPIVGQIANLVFAFITMLFVPYFYIALKKLKDGDAASNTPSVDTFKYSQPNV